ncbi:MAG TPA: hypothetical protein DCY58_05945 [Acetobacterium sp.]|nr:hypothetical protein [Acetobacterium sp.]
MTALGCPPSRQQFDSTHINIQPGPEMAGYQDWIQVDAAILTNAPLFHFQGLHTGMLQYGSPPASYNGADFPEVPMVGRIYLRYDNTRQVTVIYFVMAKDLSLVEETSTTYLQPITWPL